MGFRKELQERREIRDEYNALLRDLQSQGHRFRILTKLRQEGLGAPLWKPYGSPMTLLEFIPKRKGAKPQSTQVNHVERVNMLLEKIERHYGKKIIRRPAIERTRANLHEVLSKIDPRFRKRSPAMGRGALTEHALDWIDDHFYEKPR